MAPADSKPLYHGERHNIAAGFIRYGRDLGILGGPNGTSGLTADYNVLAANATTDSQVAASLVEFTADDSTVLVRYEAPVKPDSSSRYIGRRGSF